MGSVFDYIDWRGDIPFSQVPTGEVDSLIFSQICYIDFKRIVPASPTAKPVGFLSAAKRYMQAHKNNPTSLGFIIPPETVSVMTRAARSLRFGTTQLVGYVNKISDNEQKQFSAVTFLIGTDTCVIAFRGTDDTIIGWKECFNMSFMSPIPAQAEATVYLEAVADAFPTRKIYAVGHSKGGNLAVWASVKCRREVAERIVAVYNHDGPGFNREFLESEGYTVMRERIHTLVPQSSVVGMLLEHEENYEVVQSTYTGLLQHNAFSWEVWGGRFIHIDSVTAESRRIDATLKKWLAELSNDRRKQIIDSLYEILSSTNAKTLTELNADKLALIKAWNTLDAESRKFIRRCIGLIVTNTKKQKA